MLTAPKVCMPFGEHPKSVGAQNQNRRAHPFGCLGGYFSVSEYEPFKAFGSKD